MRTIRSAPLPLASALAAVFVITIVVIGLPRQAHALNQAQNWTFNDATVWNWNSASSTDTCGSVTQTTGGTGFAAFSQDNTGAKSSKSVDNVRSNTTVFRGNVFQSMTATGTASQNFKGKFDYSATGNSWNASAGSWVRLDLYDSQNGTYIGNLGCQTISANVSTTTVTTGQPVVLTGGTAYTIRASVIIKGANGNPTLNNIWVDNIVVSAPPVNVAAVSSASATSSLSWNVSTPATGANGASTTAPYVVYRGTASKAETFLATSTTNSYTDSTASGNATYYYWITNIDSVTPGYSESASSSEVSVLTVPGNPSAPVSSSITDGGASLSWNAPPGGAASYKIERCTGSGCTGSYTELATGVSSPYADASAASNTTYRYRVRATNATGDGNYSALSSDVTTLAVSDVTSDSVTPGDTQNVLAWTNPGADFASVVILRRASSAVTDAPSDGSSYSTSTAVGSSVVACSGNMSSCSDTGLSNGTAYHYKIFVKGQGGHYSAGHVPTGSPATPVSATFTQQAYQLFATTSASLADQDMSAQLAYAGQAFWLKLLLRVDSSNLNVIGQDFKLQFATSSGACDTSFSGETYADVTASSPISYFNGTGNDGDPLGADADLNDGARVIVNQTYEESNSFTNTQGSIANGQDGKWEFSLYDNSAYPSTSYCLRVVKNSGSVLDTYSIVPSVTTSPATTTVGDGTNGSNSAIGPGDAATEADRFSLSTTRGSDTVTAITVQLLPAASYANVASVDIQTVGGVSKCASSTITSNIVEITSCSIPVTSSAAEYKIMVAPRAHADMPAPASGASYDITATTTAFSGSASFAHSLSDSASATLTIDNLSTNNVNLASVTAGDSYGALSWANPGAADYSQTVVLRRAGSAVADVPVEGASYSAGNTIGDSTVACVTTGPSCDDTPLSNGTAYHYKIFAKDTHGNYSTGRTPTGSPATPSASSLTQQAFGAYNSAGNSALADQDAAAALSASGDAFRLKMLVRVDSAGIMQSGKSFKLQFATSSGACDTSFAGETYEDVTSTTNMAYYDGTGADADLLAADSDLVDGLRAIANQTYEEANDFTNAQSSISSGQDGKWEFSLYDRGGVTATAYCFRMVRSDGSALDSYAAVPQVTTAAGAPAITLSHYIWRNDDGDDGSATAAAGEDSPLTENIFLGDRRRLRLSLANTGSGTASGYAMRLEYASSSCTAWLTVPDYGNSAAGFEWVMDLGGVANGAATSDYAPLSNPVGKSFTSGQSRSYTNQASSVDITSSQFTEMEYSVKSTPYVINNVSYCFRVSNTGNTANFTYSSVPQIEISSQAVRPRGQGGGTIENNGTGGSVQGGNNRGGGGGGEPGSGTEPGAGGATEPGSGGSQTSGGGQGGGGSSE